MLAIPVIAPARPNSEGLRYLFPSSSHVVERPSKIPLEWCALEHRRRTYRFVALILPVHACRYRRQGGCRLLRGPSLCAAMLGVSRGKGSSSYPPTLVIGSVEPSEVAGLYSAYLLGIPAGSFSRFRIGRSFTRKSRNAIGPSCL